MSLPVWGEWIEISRARARPANPCASLPVWGEWIEISRFSWCSRISMSLPVWGEWIEMSISVNVSFGTPSSLPVWGEWIEIPSPPVLPAPGRVSPRVGRVD